MKPFARSAAAAAVAGIAMFTMSTSAHAQDAPLLSPAAMEQLVLANKLAALGEARQDPVLLMAAVRLRQGLSDDVVGLAGEGTATSDLIAKAKALAGDDKTAAAMADGLSAMSSRGCSVRYGCQNPYIQ